MQSQTRGMALVLPGFKNLQNDREPPSGLLSFYYICFLTAFVADTLSAHGREFISQGHSQKFCLSNLSESYNWFSNITNQSFKNPLETEEAAGAHGRVIVTSLSSTNAGTECRDTHRADLQLYRETREIGLTMEMGSFSRSLFQQRKNALK